jgi:hypothetical protein
MRVRNPGDCHARGDIDRRDAIRSYARMLGIELGAAGERSIRPERLMVTLMAIALAFPSVALAGRVRAVDTAKTACKSISFVYHDDCVVSYETCSVGAKRKVQRYYDGNGPTLDSIANTAMRGYDTVPAREGAYAGCFAALSAEYDRLYR